MRKSSAKSFSRQKGKFQLRIKSYKNEDTDANSDCSNLGAFGALKHHRRKGPASQEPQPQSSQLLRLRCRIASLYPDAQARFEYIPERPPRPHRAIFKGHVLSPNS